ncbi:MAG: hypothetical protein L0K86_08560 [Actinomycetia bacterium]|nr:hypothetical protein [Actinomycetes bacterium]
MGAGSTLAALLDGWRPPDRTDHDRIDAAPVAALSSVLGYDAPVAGVGDVLPPLWHWLYFLNWPQPELLGEDGHPRAGAYLPPIPNRRRMIAGGRLTAREPLRIGLDTVRTSTLSDVQVKNGRSGEMAFVTVRYELQQAGRTCVIEEHDVVYRSGEGDTDGPAASPAPVDTNAEPTVEAPWQHTYRPDPIMLFRFSALTHNSHRIHYDEPYCRTVESYPGLVVHGPLLVLLMLEVDRASAQGDVAELEYRLRRPVFAREHIVAAGAPAQDSDATDLWVATARHNATASAQVRRG